MSKKILIIEDDTDVQEFIVDTLEKYTQIVCDDGASGLKAFEEVTPDLIVCDHKMPGMNGLDVVLKLRELDKAVPILIFSGALTPDLYNMYIKYGVTEVLSKPISSDELKSEVKKRLK